MRKQIGFFTGARSDYGIMKRLIDAVAKSDKLDYQLYVSGVHLLPSFGFTIDEIKNDGLTIKEVIEVYREDYEPGFVEFSDLITKLSGILKNEKPDVMFILGDRSEAYAAALACHFLKVPIIHSGGGTITEGAVDNIYRYNISNLSDVIFATSKGSYNRLLNAPITSKKKLIFTGSLAIDAIERFRQEPIPIASIIPELKNKNYALMTFHPVTQSEEAIDQAMDLSLKLITERGINVLITYPNNDPGYKSIIKVIEKWQNHDNVIVRKNLGAIGYYSALNSCEFVIGNSSSGLMEAPYFNKQVVNIGTRQEGREHDSNVKTISCDSDNIRQVIENGVRNAWPEVTCERIYGNGNALKTIMDYLNH